MPEWVSTQGGLTLCQAFPFPAQRSHLPEVPRYGCQSWSVARGAHVTRFAVVACNRAAQRVPGGRVAALRSRRQPCGGPGSPGAAFSGHGVWSRKGAAQTHVHAVPSAAGSSRRLRRGR